MKRRFLFMMVLMTITALTVSAQQQEPVMTRSQFTPFKKIAPVKLPVRPMGDTATTKRSSINDKYYQEGMLLGAGSLGKVYRMPVDNMLCLVPDNTKTTRMPVKKTKAPEQMPNGFLRREGWGGR